MNMNWTATTINEMFSVHSFSIVHDSPFMDHRYAIIQQLCSCTLKTIEHNSMPFIKPNKYRWDKWISNHGLRIPFRFQFRYGNRACWYEINNIYFLNVKDGEKQKPRITHLSYTHTHTHQQEEKKNPQSMFLCSAYQ